MLQQFFGTELDFWVRLAVSLIVIAALLGLTALILRRMSRNRGAPMAARPRTGRARLSVVDAVHVDQERRLVLVRRDDTEHLLLTGGASDLVVEHNIPVRSEAPHTVREAIAPRTPEQVAHGREPVAAVSAPIEKPAFPTRSERALEAPPVSMPEPEIKAEPLPIRDRSNLKAAASLTDEAPLSESIRNRPGRRAFEPSVVTPVVAAAALQGAGAVRPRMPALAELTTGEDKPETDADRTRDVQASPLPLISEEDLLDSGDLIVTGQDDEQDSSTADDSTEKSARDKEQALAEAAAREAEKRAAIEAAEQEAREIVRQEQERAELEAAERAAAQEAAEAAAREEEALAAIAAAEREAEERAALEAAQRAAEQEAIEAAAREAEAREQAEREAAERAAIAEAERQAQAEREAAERAAIEAAEKEAAERAAREAAEQEAAERAAIEAAERAAMEAAERAVQEAAEQAAREAAEQAAIEAAAREAQRAAEERAAIEAAEQQAAALAAFEAAAREAAEREAAETAAREAREAAEQEAARAAAEALALDEKIAAEMAAVLQEMEKERQAQPEITAQPDDRVKDIAARLDSALNAPADLNAHPSGAQDNSSHLSLSDLLDDLQEGGGNVSASPRPVMPEAPQAERRAELHPQIQDAPPVEPHAPSESAAPEPRPGSRFGQIFSRTGTSYARPRIDASPRTPVAPPRPAQRTEPIARPRTVAGSIQRDQPVPLLGAAHREPQSVEATREQVSASRIRPPSPMTSRRADLLSSLPGAVHPSAHPAGHAEDRPAPVIEKPAQNDPATDFLEDFESEIANLLGRTPGSKL